MTEIFTFFPLESELEALADLAKPLRVFQKPESRCVEIERSNRKDHLTLAVNEYGVIHQFDHPRMNCFSSEDKPSEHLIASVDWDRVECLFVFQWRRPALPGEYPPGYSEIQGANRQAFVRSSIPDSALTIAVSMVGLTFWINNYARPIYGILEGEMPTTIRPTQDPELIEGFIENNETARLEDVDDWILDCTRWLEGWEGVVKHVKVKPGPGL